jgi:hypothetical protein
MNNFIKDQMLPSDGAYVLGTAHKRCLQIDSSALAH